MRNRVGPYLTAEDFFDRKEVMDRLVELLERGEHVSLIAQRRIGKTSLLKEIERRRKDHLRCLYVDLQSSHDAADAMVAVALAARSCTTLWTKFQGTFSNVLSSVESVGPEELRLRIRDGLVGDWRVKGDRMLADMAGHDLPVVLMLDELPVLLVRMLREANMFDFGPPSLWAPALSLLEGQDEDHVHCTLRLCLLGAVRGPRALLDRLRADLDGEPMKYDNTTLQRLTMQMAAAGGLREAIELCSLPAVALAMEPMVVALRLRLGETVDAPVEMLEMAPDVNARVDALIATGDTWRKDPLALILPDEVGQSDEGIHVEPHGIAGAH